MTRIDFYFNAPDKNELACKIATKAFRQSMRVAVYAPDDADARSVDRMLWMLAPTGFVPHCRAGSPLAAETAVVIAVDIDTLPEADLLVNLGSEPPAAFGRYLRLVEIVSLDGADRHAARKRFRFYRDRGYEMISHDLAAESPADTANG